MEFLDYPKKDWMENSMEEELWEDHDCGGKTTSGGTRCCWT